jgi:hypothetical protein
MEKRLDIYKKFWYIKIRFLWIKMKPRTYPQNKAKENPKRFFVGGENDA